MSDGDPFCRHELVQPSRTSLPPVRRSLTQSCFAPKDHPRACTLSTVFYGSSRRRTCEARPVRIHADGKRQPWMSIWGLSLTDAPKQCRREMFQQCRGRCRSWGHFCKASANSLQALGFPGSGGVHKIGDGCPRAASGAGPPLETTTSLAEALPPGRSLWWRCYTDMR